MIEFQVHPVKGKHMQPNLRSDIVRSIRRRVDLEEYRAIRRLWIAHSMAEEAHDIPGLMATLTEDCIYTVANSGVSWQGKAGATYQSQWLDMPSPTGKRVEFAVTILFPWDSKQKLFSGERVYFFIK